MSEHREDEEAGIEIADFPPQLVDCAVTWTVYTLRNKDVGLSLSP